MQCAGSDMFDKMACPFHKLLAIQCVKKCIQIFSSFLILSKLILSCAHSNKLTSKFTICSLKKVDTFCYFTTNS